MIEIWFRRQRGGNVKTLVKFDYVPFYLEVDFTYFWKRCNKRIKLTVLNISPYHSYYKPFYNFPGWYKSSYGKGLHMKGKIIYNHEVAREILKKFKIRH